MGDFNSQPHSIIMRIIQSCGQLSDSFADTHSPPPSITSSHHRSLSPLEVLHTHGITCDSPLNTYSAPKLKHKSPSDDVILRGGKRLDYILYSSPPDSSQRLRAESSSVKLTDPIPHLNVSYSDHFALESIFSLSPSPASNLPPSPSPDLLSPALSTLHAAYRHNLSFSRLQLKLFLLALAFVPILATASSFLPLHYLNWIFTLLGVATGVGGATMLYTGFVGGQWEAGALKNVIGEIEDEVERIRRKERREEGGESRDSVEFREGLDADRW